ncbi:PEP/pyruvate-binding domain-containing protein [Algoriphagus halophilus]|uniref:PEP/pyruvate-binding domain-containing protein n=1 Tax=Algoriphagus halophilus TaxID=226505 RepID=UPI00358E8B15
MNDLVISFETIGIGDVPKVGGKNASLGEMYQKLTPLGIRIPNGFAVTAAGYGLFLKENKLNQSIQEKLSELDLDNFSNLREVSGEIKSLILHGKVPDDLAKEIVHSYQSLGGLNRINPDVAVRSSATAEDLPGASFAGLHESFLNIKGEQELLKAVRSCFASLYNGRAIKYRHDKGFDHLEIALSVGVQLMVRADKASSGVCFSIDPESGFSQSVLITGCWGLGENIVQGAVIPDEFLVFKPSIKKGKRAILSKKVGSKTKTMIYSKDGGVVNLDTSKEKQKAFVLNDEEIEILGQWAIKIENHYGMPMDIEWAKDGLSGDLFIVQARPETVHADKDPYLLKEYALAEKGELLCSGYAIGGGITSGKVKIILSPSEADQLEEGDILVTENTNPDWDPVMKKQVQSLPRKEDEPVMLQLWPEKWGLWQS